MSPSMGSLIGALLGNLVSLSIMGLIFYLGIKGFSDEGLPLTRGTRLKGATGMIVGAACMLLSGWLVWAAYFSHPSSRPYQPPKPPPQAAARTAPPPASAQAVTFRSPIGNCIISAPVLLHDVPTQTLPNGARIHIYTATDTRTRSVYTLGYVDIPDGLPANVQSQTTDTITGAGLSPLHTENLVYAGHYQTVEVSGFASDRDFSTRGISRGILVQRRLYLLMAVGPETLLTEAMARKFLDSFKLITDPATPE